MWTLYPSVPGGDSGELILASCRLGVPHPPGYPTFAMLGWLFIRLLPWRSPAWRVNVLSAVCNAASVAFLLLASAVATRNLAASAFASLLWAFSPMSWTYATQAEVFALNNAIVAALLYLTVHYVYFQHRWAAYAGAFTLGLAATNQHTVALFAVPLLLSVLYLGHADLLQSAVLVRLAAFLLLGASPYAYLPWASAREILTSWGDCTTVAGFFRHVLRREYGTFKLAQMEASSGIAPAVYRAWLYFAHLPAESNYLGAVLAPLGIFYPWVALLPSHGREGLWCGRVAQQRVRVVLLAMLGFYLAVFNYLANLPLHKEQYVGVFKRFWMQPNLIFFILVAQGADALLRSLPSSTSPPASSRRSTSTSTPTPPSAGARGWTGMAGHGRLAVVVVLVAVAGGQLARNYDLMDQSSNWYIERFARAVLDPLPPRAVLLTKGDIIVNSVRYMMFCEGHRTDVLHMDFELMSLPWFARIRPFLAPLHFPGTHYHPKERGAFRMAALLDAIWNTSHTQLGGIYVAGGWKEDSDKQHTDQYDMFPRGIAYRLYKKVPPPTEDDMVRWHDDAVAAVVPHSLFAFPIDNSKYGGETWEHVVDNDYWECRNRIGFSLLMWAIENNNNRAALHLAANLYDRLIPDSPYKPFHLYKNQGIAYGRLALYEPEYNVKMVEAFRKYLALADKTEKDYDAIWQSVNQALRIPQSQHP